MDEELWYYADLAAYTKKSIDAVRKGVSRGDGYPPPTGKMGRSPYWLPSTVKKFYANTGGGKNKGGRPRKPLPKIQGWQQA